MVNHNLITLVIPAHNEAANIGWFFEELSSYLKANCPDYDFEYVIVDDGSTDDTLAKIKKIAATEERVSYLSLSRNFGKEAATSAGLRAAKGASAIMIDADGQHPYELIPRFIEEWRSGGQIVVGVRASNQKEGVTKRYGSKIFYRLLDFLNETDVTPAATDFRLIDRQVLNEFNKLTEHNRITRGLLDWLGFKQIFVDFHAAPRRFGKATYSNTKLLRLALNSFIAHSTKPLKMIGLLGVLVTVLSAFVGVFILVEEWILNDPLSLSISGTALLAVFLAFLTGLTLSSLGLLALYIETIHSETQNRPLFVVAETNIKD